MLRNAKVLAALGTSGGLGYGAWVYLGKEQTVERKLLIPMKDPSVDYGSKYTIVVDMDETLLHTTFKPNGKGASVNVRAFSAELLKGVSEISEMVLWTAGTEDYAIQALKLIGPEEELFHHRIYRSPLWFTMMSHVKSLRRLNRDLDYTIIVDNSPAAIAPEDRYNALVVTDFFNNKKDVELKDVLKILQELTASGLPVQKFLKQKVASGDLREDDVRLVHMPPPRTFSWF
eukprot:TRINITY_DN19385_c0_g1_i1.p1 TRINITY_DN19385_c0_g1~~TRINITY_DN19385_c0_g1_i1.p1  ORF type:complete len:249 (+),score=66.60 TRINITY_DN19385_c0_g1_i1:56-748(+)